MNLLAIGAHPHDVEFGCAGTLMKYADNGHGVYMMVTTEGGMGGDPSVRREEAEEAARLMGVREILWGNYRDTEIDAPLPSAPDDATGRREVRVHSPSFPSMRPKC